MSLKSAQNMPQRFHPPAAANPAYSRQAAGVEALLGAVVAASRELLCSDFEAGLQGALRVLVDGAGVDRAYAVRYDHDLQAGFFVAEHCAPGIATVLETTGAGPYSYADYEEVWRPLLAGQSYTSPFDEKTGANAELNRVTHTKRDLFVPVFLGDVFWGALGFDDCTTGRAFAKAEIDVLRAAAAAVAAALGRSDGERARAEELAGLAELLEKIVSSARRLINEADFEAGLLRWLGELGRAMRATRATYYDCCVHQESGLPSVRMLCEWCAPEATGNIAVSFAAPFVIDPRGAEEGVNALISGRAVAFYTEDCTEPMLSFLRDQGNATVLAVPVFIDGRQYGALSYDFAERRTFDSAVLAILQTAADTLSAILRRNEAVALALNEREARIASENARAVELARLNLELERRNRLLDASARASALLSASEDFDAAVREALGIVAQAAEFDGMLFVEYVDPEGRPDPRFFRIIYAWDCGGLEQAEAKEKICGTHDDMPRFAAGILQRDSILDYRREELPDLATSELQRGMESHYYLTGGIWIDNRPWGAFSCDDRKTDRRRSEEEKGVIAAAARAIGQAVHRRRLERRTEALQHQILTEREQAAVRRATELAQANEALRRSGASLVAETDVGKFLCVLMAETTRLSGAKSAGVFSFDESDGTLRMEAFMTEGRGVDIASDPLMETVAASGAAGNRGAMGGRAAGSGPRLVRQRDATGRAPLADQPGWHRELGHRHVFDVPLHAGGRLIGIFGQCFAEGASPADFDHEHTRILANHAGLGVADVAPISRSARGEYSDGGVA